VLRVSPVVYDTPCNFHLFITFEAPILDAASTARACSRVALKCNAACLSANQGCDSRTRGNHARGLKKFTSRGIHAVFTWESRAVYLRYRPQIYGKYGGIGVLFGSGGSSYLQVPCVVRLPLSLFSLSLFAPRFGFTRVIPRNSRGKENFYRPDVISATGI